MRQFLIAMTRNPVSLTGVALTTASAVLILALFAIELVGFVGNPYVGILAFLILPGFFVLGLACIPVGIVWQRRREARARDRGEPASVFPVIDLNTPRTQRLAVFFVLFTMVNLVILAAATYKGVEVMESTEFCGDTCHSVMQPERTAHLGSPHSRVGCVDCHIGPGADWFAKSKLSGAWQVVSTTFGLYPRPIPTPVHDLRPARETCEQCHWPTKFVGDRLRVLTRYEENEANTATKSVLLLRVGGMQGRLSQGIHWHVDPSVQIRYLADDKRETIYDVELTLPDGTTKVFRKGEAPAAETQEEGGPVWRTMDCVDCHNRPTHIYSMPGDAVDLALEQGRLDASLPYIRREAVKALRASYESHEAASAGIPAAFSSYYRENYPSLSPTAASSVSAAGPVLADIFSKNVFPAMKVEWGTYPDHIGHRHFDGCFRCHDDEHEADDGETISQDCSTCHTLLAMEEESPEVLELLQP